MMNPLYDYFQRNRVMVKIEKAQKTKARNLSLDDFDLTSFPEKVLTCQNLRSLCLQRNTLRELPKDIGTHLHGLGHLSIQYNNFDSFPSCIKNLKHLVTLNISHNPIKDLTKDIGCLTNLEVLWCNNCCLTSLPEELGNLLQMETFGARNNKIHKLPESITNWENLKWLTLEGNTLNSLPNNFEKLKSLKHVNLNKNNFSYIPQALSKIELLRYLHLEHNFFVYLPENIILAMPNVKINLMNNPLTVINNDKMYTNVVLNGSEAEFFSLLGVNSADDVNDDSSEDWENSLHSLELNYSSSDSSESEDDDVIERIPKLSKYFITY